MKLTRKIVFCDRDGVLNIDTGYPRVFYNSLLNKDTASGLRKLYELNFEFIIVTNQSGVARGILTEEEVIKFNEMLAQAYCSEGVQFLDIAYCPHHPDAKVEKYKYDCNCRKPKPGMITKMIDKYELDPAQCFMIGDKPTDVMAGINAGCKRSFLLDGHSQYGDMNSIIKHIIDL